MAYMSQEMKKAKTPAIKAVLKKYGMKGSIAVRHYSTLVVNLKSGDLDLIGAANRFNEEYARRRGQTFYPVKGHYQVNPYYEVEHARDMKEETIGNFFEELLAVMYGDGYYDNSDAMTDYFDTAWYVNVNVGKWDKEYEYTGA